MPVIDSPALEGIAISALIVSLCLILPLIAFPLWQLIKNKKNKKQAGAKKEEQSE